MTAIIDATQVTPTVEVVEVRTSDHLGQSSTQFEVRCSQCPMVEIWEYERHAVANAGKHVCATVAVEGAPTGNAGNAADRPAPTQAAAVTTPSTVTARLRRVWDTAALPITSKPGEASAAMFAEVRRILDDFAVPRTERQLHILRWVCGYEPETVGALVELMVVGREVQS